MAINKEKNFKGERMLARAQDINTSWAYKGCKVRCKKCRRLFGVNCNYIGVITCPYCGELVEQP